VQVSLVEDASSSSKDKEALPSTPSSLLKWIESSGASAATAPQFHISSNFGILEVLKGAQ
jgi:hypothetical protein